MALDAQDVAPPGAGMGMGRAAAIRFVGDGARVGLIDRDEAAVADTAAEIERAGGDGLVLVADVTDEEQVAAAVDRLSLIHI